MAGRSTDTCRVEDTFVPAQKPGGREMPKFLLHASGAPPAAGISHPRQASNRRSRPVRTAQNQQPPSRALFGSSDPLFSPRTIRGSDHLRDMPHLLLVFGCSCILRRPPPSRSSPRASAVLGCIRATLIRAGTGPSMAFSGLPAERAV